MRDFSRRTEKIAICRGEWEISRSVAENVKNRDLSRRIGNFAVSYMPRNPFVPDVCQKTVTSHEVNLFFIQVYSMFGVCNQPLCYLEIFSHNIDIYIAIDCLSWMALPT